MPDTAYPWEGPTTFIRPKVTRGSASGANWSEVHILAATEFRGDLAACRVLIPVSVRSKTAKVDSRTTLPVCPKCLASLPAKPPRTDERCWPHPCRDYHATYAHKSGEDPCGCPCHRSPEKEV